MARTTVKRTKAEKPTQLQLGVIPPVPQAVDVMPDCPTCKHNRSVRHIQMNEYWCNDCKQEFCR